MDGILLVDKEKGITSRDVVNQISKKLNIKVIERDKENLQNIYDIGYNDTKKLLESLKKYLKEK